MLQPNQPADFFHVEALVEEALSRLKNELSEEWLTQTTVATYLPKTLQEVIVEYGVGNNWHTWVQQPIKNIGQPDQSILNMTLGFYLGKQDMSGPGAHLYWLNSAYINKKLDTCIGELIPDLVIQAPNKEMWVWDLTSQYVDEHMSKTILYSNILSSNKQVCHIGETYWTHFKGQKEATTA